MVTSCCGTLRKKNGFRYRSQHFTLDEHWLLQWTELGIVKWRFDVSKLELVENIEGDPTIFCLKGSTLNKPLILKAETESEKMKWCTGLADFVCPTSELDEDQKIRISRRPLGLSFSRQSSTIQSPTRMGHRPHGHSFSRQPSSVPGDGFPRSSSFSPSYIIDRLCSPRERSRKSESLVSPTNRSVPEGPRRSTSSPQHSPARPKPVLSVATSSRTRQPGSTTPTRVNSLHTPMHTNRRTSPERNTSCPGPKHVHPQPLVRPSLHELAPLERSYSVRSSEDGSECEQIGPAVYMDGFVEGWEVATRKIDTTLINQDDDVITQCLSVFPELIELHVSAITVVRKSTLELVDVFAEALRDQPDLHELALMLSLIQPVVQVNLLVDYAPKQREAAELLYFSKDLPSLQGWVGQRFPLCRRFFQGLRWGGDEGPEQDLNPATDWGSLQRHAKWIRVITGFSPEDKAALLKAWKSSISARVPTTLKSPVVALSSTLLCDRIQGLVYGLVLGAVMGLATEGMVGEEVLKAYADPLHTLEVTTVRGPTGRGWATGDWTCTLDLMFLVMDSLVRRGGVVDLKDLACALYNWRASGNSITGHAHPSEETVDFTDQRVIDHPYFLTDPQFASDCVLQEDGERTATSVVLLRSILMGCTRISSTDPESAIRDTLEVTRLTHSHSRCLAAAVAVTSAVQQLLNSELVDPLIVSNLAFEKALPYVSETVALEHHMSAEALIELDLDDPAEVASVFKALGCGFYSLRSKDDFKTTIRRVVCEAGNAVVNTAISGALLGCRVGYAELPRDWLSDLVHPTYLSDLSRAFLESLRLRPTPQRGSRPPSPSTPPEADPQPPVRRAHSGTGMLDRLRCSSKSPKRLST